MPNWLATIVWILILFGTPALFVFYLRYSFFGQGSTARTSDRAGDLGGVSRGDVERFLQHLDEPHRVRLIAMYSECSSQIPERHFQKLYAALALTTNNAAAELGNDLLLGEYFSSLTLVELVGLVENLNGINLADEQLEKIRYFSDLVREVGVSLERTDIVE